MAVAREIGIIPFAYVVQRERNIYIGITAHIIVNTLDVLTVILVLG